jgi:hypothetical protein
MLTEFVESLDCSIEDFYREVRDAQAEDQDEYLKYFIDCLLASADYESFYKVMSKHGKLQQAAGGAASTSAADSKADSKKLERKASSSKKGDDDDEDYAADGKDSK